MIQSPQFQKNNFYYNQTYQPFYYYYPQNAYNDYNSKFYNYNNYLPMYYYNHPFRQPELFIQKNKFDLNIKKNDFDFKKSTGKKKIIHTKEKNKTYTRQKVEGDKKGFIFETEKLNNAVGNSDNKNENYMEYLKKNHNLDKNIRELQGSEFNNSIENSELKKISLKSLNKIADQKLVKTYVQRYEGIAPDSNVNKKIIREYVDQILDNEFDKRFSDFVVKMRDIYFKKKLLNPLKVKKRFVVGMREIEKYLKLEEVKLVFFVPNIEKVEGENSLDSRILKILKECDKKNVPRFFGLNKFKLGKIARKKHSNVSILAFINVEGFEREFSDLIELGQKFIKNFYEKYQDKKDMFVNNKFIDMNSFDLYKKV
jgi:ribosomal protein L7Ae-like RNA K-turn-binding protein